MVDQAAHDPGRNTDPGLRRACSVMGHRPWKIVAEGREQPGKGEVRKIYGRECVGSECGSTRWL